MVGPVPYGFKALWRCLVIHRCPTEVDGGIDRVCVRSFAKSVANEWVMQCSIEGLEQAKAVSTLPLY